MSEDNQKPAEVVETPVEPENVEADTAALPEAAVGQPEVPEEGGEVEAASESI